MGNNKILNVNVIDNTNNIPSSEYRIILTDEFFSNHADELSKILNYWNRVKPYQDNKIEFYFDGGDCKIQDTIKNASNIVENMGINFYISSILNKLINDSGEDKLIKDTMEIQNKKAEKLGHLLINIWVENKRLCSTSYPIVSDLSIVMIAKYLKQQLESLDSINFEFKYEFILDGISKQFINLNLPIDNIDEIIKFVEDLIVTLKIYKAEETNTKVEIRYGKVLQSIKGNFKLSKRLYDMMSDLPQINVCDGYLNYNGSRVELSTKYIHGLHVTDMEDRLLMSIYEK